MGIVVVQQTETELRGGARAGMVKERPVIGNHGSALHGDTSIPNFDTATCRCGMVFSRTSWQAHSNLKKCKPCRLAYKHDLAKRKAQGASTQGPDCRFCGETTHKKNTSGFHPFCAWVDRLGRLDELKKAESDRSRERWVREQANPTKERTWRILARKRLKEARKLIRDASRSPTQESKPARTSPS